MTHDSNDPEILKAALAQALDARDEAVEREKAMRWEIARAHRYLIDSQPDNAEDVLRAALDQSRKEARS